MMNNLHSRHKQQTEHHATSSWVDLSEDIWIKIIQYLCWNSISNPKHNLQNPSYSIPNLLQTLALVSKHFHKICRDYVKIIPLDIPTGTIGDPRKLPMIDWMCRQHVKIGTFDASSYHDINITWLRIIVYMLKACNTLEMKSFIMKSDFSLVGVKELGNIVDVEKAGISLDTTTPLDLLFSSEDDYQALLANTLLEQAPNLRSMSLIVQDNGWYRLFLENFLETMEELELYAYAGEFYSYHYTEQQDISHFIENMKSLKQLTLTGEFRGSLSILSTTLERIDIRDMAKHSDFVVDCCICPSLQFFSCAWDAEHATCIGLEPAVPVGEFELSFDESGKSDVMVQFRPFCGLVVPPTCIVSLVHKRFLL
jgi:hypothetical protein